MKKIKPTKVYNRILPFKGLQVMCTVKMVEGISKDYQQMIQAYCEVDGKNYCATGRTKGEALDRVVEQIKNNL